MSKKKRKAELDTETTIANMNVEGFSWYDPKRNGKYLAVYRRFTQSVSQVKTLTSQLNDAIIIICSIIRVFDLNENALIIAVMPGKLGKKLTAVTEIAIRGKYCVVVKQQMTVVRWFCEISISNQLVPVK